MFYLRRIYCSPIYRQFSTKSKVKLTVQLDEYTNDSLDKELIKPRKHPGVDKKKCIELPAHLINTFIKSLKDYPIKSVCRDAEVLNRYLKARHLPPEQHEILNRRKSIEQDVITKMQTEMKIDIDSSRDRKQINDKVESILKQKLYTWKPVAYDAYKSLEYLFGRSAQEFSIVSRIFSEIAQRYPDFKPRSFFDFGSGVGTGIWAASELWKNSIFEYFLVDTSRDMNDLSELILRDGDENKDMPLRNVNYRQFLPSSGDLKYDLVLSAFTLLELPDAKTRLETVLNLWNKCDRYLVIVEQGTRSGFKAVNEARDFILHSSAEKASIFSPCSHDFHCPRYVANDGTPCNFVSAYQPLPFFGGNINEPKYDLYSYVVIEKIHEGNSRNKDDLTKTWPRLVRPTLVRARHSICRMCCSDGQLKEIIFTQSKHGKNMYRCAKSSNWGDRLPISITENSEIVNKLED